MLSIGTLYGKIRPIIYDAHIRAYLMIENVASVVG